MRAIPKIEEYYLKGFNAPDYDHYYDDLEQWSYEAKVSLNAGDYLIKQLKKENKELKEDVRKIKVIMGSDLMKSGDMEVMSIHSFYDIELTKINWIKEKKEVGEILARWQKECYGWTIDVNDNKTYYDSATKRLSDRDAISSDPLDIDSKIREQMELSNQYVSIQVYPDNGVGSYEVFHYSVIGAILEMDKVLKEN